MLHTGDIKLDQLPLDGRLTDLAGFSRLGDEGVDLFLVDSTNAEVPGFVAPEREIGPVIDSCSTGRRQRVIVASFASHVHRVQQMLRRRGQAQPQGRLRRPVDGAQHADRRRTGLPERARRPARSLDKALDLPDHELVLVSTGSQGEPLSALSRMSRGDHRTVRSGRRTP